MMRSSAPSLSFVLGILLPAWGYAQAPPAPDELEQNIVYELLINGESFLVEGNRVVKVRSEQNPDAEYEVAIRVAPTQRYRMPSLEFTYERPARIERDPEGGRHVVQVVHELGFSIRIHDLGGTLDEEAQQRALGILTESVADSYREQGAGDIQVGNPFAPRKFGEWVGLGTTIRYRDEGQIGHTCMIYVLAGDASSATCVIRFLDRDRDDVLPLVRRTLESFRALPEPDATR